MGYGSWSSQDYDTYTYTTRGVSSDVFTSNATSYTAQEVYRSRSLDSELNPYKVMRKCSDCEEHPNTLPVILALDVTGSMGDASVRVAKKLNEIMTELYNNVQDIEFCVMGIGDLAYDDAPIQMSQYESDIRIAEQLDKIYFEAGGGGNKYESYTAAWYMGLRHSDLDCWKRGQKGIVITLGDEGPNPYLPWHRLKDATGDNLQGDIETQDLYNEACEKFNIYHIAINDVNSSYSYHSYHYHIDDLWRNLLGDNYKVSTLNNLAENIINIIQSNINGIINTVSSKPELSLNENNEVTW